MIASIFILFHTSIYSDGVFISMIDAQEVHFAIAHICRELNKGIGYGKAIYNTLSGDICAECDVSRDNSLRMIAKSARVTGSYCSPIVISDKNVLARKGIDDIRNVPVDILDSIICRPPVCLIKYSEYLIGGKAIFIDYCIKIGRSQTRTISYDKAALSRAATLKALPNLIEMPRTT